jgi:hypothetical protein
LGTLLGVTTVVGNTTSHRKSSDFIQQKTTAINSDYYRPLSLPCTPISVGFLVEVACGASFGVLLTDEEGGGLEAREVYENPPCGPAEVLFDEEAKLFGLFCEVCGGDCGAAV